MKLQYLAVIFVIIMLPISLVVSFYIQAQIDIVNMQTLYKTKLNDATYDAVKAFQLNTTNSYYSGVSDAKIRDIEASINTFYNSFTSSTSYTRDEIRSCVPAMVYTLYDGYYIYGKRYNVYDVEWDTSSSEKEMEKVKIDTSATNSEKYDYGLRPFSYYSCRYKVDNDNDVTINYTLDNFISVYGKVNGEYVNKSGFLISNISSDKWNGNEYKKATIAKTEKIEEYLKINKKPEIKEAIGTSREINLQDKMYQYVVYNSQKIYRGEADGVTYYFWYTDGEAKLVIDENVKENVRKQMDEEGNNSATKYYVDAQKFTNWFYTGDEDRTTGNEGIGNKITQKDVILLDQSSDQIGDLDFKVGDSEKIFDKDEDPEDPGSKFNQHRMSIIKRTIESNLAIAINSYNSNSDSYAFGLPKLNSEEWEKVTNNVCVIAFMQGLQLKGRYFNSYAVVPNDKNNEFVDTDAIYLLTEDSVKNEYKYHMPNCPLLVKNIDSIQNKITTGYINTSFERQTLTGRTETINKPDGTTEEKTDPTEYYYKHVRGYDAEGKPLYYTACYHCIVNPSGEYELDEILSGKILNKDSKFGPKVGNYISGISELRKHYLTALAREKYDLYKTNN